MKAIQPLDIWSGGDTKTAVSIRLYISYDDLESQSALIYKLYDVDAVNIYEGQIFISGQDYINWGASGDSNLEAYTIAATQLNLTLL